LPLQKAFGYTPAMPYTCRYCFAPLTNNHDFCKDACEDGASRICPTLDDEIYKPEPQEPPPFYERDDIYITRPALELPPQPYEAAPRADREFIAATRLRQHLIMCGL
jgi:hypothetical protein